ncbi:MAG: peptide chain release factor N(5)-glutamine methyltransferase [Betaproteobacteria bacterium]
MSSTISTLVSQSTIDTREVEMILAHVLACTRAYVIAHGERVLDENEAMLARRLIARRATGEPFAYVVGTREFYGQDFQVTAATLIPRPETELLVEQALARLPEPNRPAGRARASVLDMGTGSGAIAITLALARNDIVVTATDMSVDALQIARDNAHRLGATVEFMNSNWYDALAGRRFDLIVSNPPYVAGGDAHLGRGDLRFEPKTALTDGSADGLASIRAIIAGAPAHLNAGGWLLFEHGYDQAAAARELLLEAGFNNLIFARDLAGIERVSGGQIR